MNPAQLIWLGIDIIAWGGLAFLAILIFANWRASNHHEWD